MSSREIKSGLCVLAAALLVGGTEYGRAQAGQAPAGGQGAGRGAAPAGQAAGRGAARGPLLDKDRIRFQPEEAEAGGAIFGNSSQPGVYIVRNVFRAPNGGSRPHYHDQDRWVNVIKGTWWTAVGDFYDADKMIAIKEGGMMYHPAGLHHYDGAKAATGDVTVQITGIGPVATVQSEVDAQGNPVSRGGGAGAAGRGAAPAPGQ